MKNVNEAKESAPTLKKSREPHDVRLVSAADKLTNAREILADYRVEGDAVFHRFAGRKDGTRSLVTAFRKAGSNALIDELDRVVTELEHLSK